ncbi:hypothetical protein K466DRAFT_357745 [Polyporus arcularius HHB13444]|uniref:Uncharacterized protein n=1 Tax=Polyporus arcularius HHB13444 TaxID=1314778 RepID=A0A5C3NUP8_9APHY|nr:hypothetical protein K466DRAFT_357745 [Polyporus arcularius HHB13444]
MSHDRTLDGMVVRHCLLDLWLLLGELERALKLSHTRTRTRTDLEPSLRCSLAPTPSNSVWASRVLASLEPDRREWEKRLVGRVYPSLGGRFRHSTDLDPCQCVCRSIHIRPRPRNRIRGMPVPYTKGSRPRPQGLIPTDSDARNTLALALENHGSSSLRA